MGIRNSVHFRIAVAAIFAAAFIVQGCATAPPRMNPLPGELAEQVRAGIESIPRGQSMAGYAMGLTTKQLYRYLLIPVGYRIIVPPLTSEFLTIFKNSSLALTIGVAEVLYQARQIENYTFQGFEAFTAATLIYLVVTMIAVVIMDRVEARTRIPGYGVQGKT